MGKFTELFDFFGPEVIPIIAWNGRLSPTSAIDPARGLGKIPGVYHPQTDDWVGMADWTSRVFTRADAEVWDTWPNANVGLRAKHFPAIDIDEDTDVALVEQVLDDLSQGLGEKTMPIRYRANSARVLVPLSSTPISKQRLTYERRDSAAGVIELLGDGQQYLVCGMHPSGFPYQWRMWQRAKTVQTLIDLLS